jgi:hypothetical protein
MSDHRANKALNVPLIKSELQEGEPGGQASISGAQGAMAQAMPIAQIQPRRAASAASATQGGVAQRHRGAGSTCSRAAEKSTASVGDSGPLKVQMGKLFISLGLYPRFFWTQCN